MLLSLYCRFVGMFELVVGKSNADVVRRLDSDDLPVVVILAKVRMIICLTLY